MMSTWQGKKLEKSLQMMNMSADSEKIEKNIG